MAIKIVNYESQDKPVEKQLIIDTVERNRDRIRTVANMALTVSGIMISTSVAVIIFSVDKQVGGNALPVAFGFAALFFFFAACVSIYSSLLRTKYTISSETKFVTDLIRLYYSELRLLRLCFLPLALGFFMIIGSIILFISLL